MRDACRRETHMDAERLLLAITGAAVGVFGWLLVGPT